MNKSEQINELATALSKFQGEITDVHKDKSGYGYKYADLSQILFIARPLLSKHGLSITQLCGSAHDKVTVETVLMHASGQWISSIIEMGVEKGKGMSLAQAVGSVVTYARRYAFAAAVGLTQTDDDAAVVEAEPVKPLKTKPKVNGDATNTDVHIEFMQLFTQSGQPPEKLQQWCETEGVDNVSQIPVKKVEEAIARLRKSSH